MDQVKKWKHEHGRVFKKVLEGQEVYYRLLNVEEIIKYTGVDESLTHVIPDLVILNGVKLKLPGSYVSISQHVVNESSFGDLDDFKACSMENRHRIKTDIDEGVYYGMIAQVCRILPYKPEELLLKSEAQLMEIVAWAEVISGNHIVLTGDEAATIPTARPNVRESDTFEPPDVDSMMRSSQDALAAEMAKYGQSAPTLKEKKKEELGKDLTDLQRKMKELQGL